jgi:pyrimidine deaminase RibD-like protein
MNDQQIFSHLFEIAKTSNDTRGVVAACLVRNGAVILSGTSSDGRYHAEYNLLKEAQELAIKPKASDILYVTMQPCNMRHLTGNGGDLFDCTTVILGSGIKKVIFGVKHPEGFLETTQRFKEAGSELSQTEDLKIQEKCKEIFNSTLIDPTSLSKKIE